MNAHYCTQRLNPPPHAMSLDLIFNDLILRGGYDVPWPTPLMLSILFPAWYAFDLWYARGMMCKICKRLPIPPSCFVFLHFFPCLRWPIAYISHSPSRNIHLLGNTSLKKLWTFFMLCFYFLVNFYHHNHQKYQNYNYHVQGVVGVIWAMPERKCFFF